MSNVRQRKLPNIVEFLMLKTQQFSLIIQNCYAILNIPSASSCGIEVVTLAPAFSIDLLHPSDGTVSAYLPARLQN